MTVQIAPRAASSVVAPQSGVDMFVDAADNVLKYRDSVAMGGGLKALGRGLLASLAGPTAALTAADTLVIASPSIPTNTLVAGLSAFRIRLRGQYAGTVTQVCSFRVHMGPAGTIADTTLITLASVAGGTAAIGFEVEFTVVVNSIGAGGSVMAGGDGTLNGLIPPSNTTPVAVNTAVANILSVSMGPAAATANLTARIATIEAL